MKEIKRYDIVIDGDRTRSIESERGYWCKYSEVEQLQARIKELESDCGDFQLLQMDNQRLSWLIANMMQSVGNIEDFEL